MNQSTRKPPVKKNIIRSSNKPDNLYVVETLEEYKKLVGGNQKLVVVRFYAPWCKVCSILNCSLPYYCMMMQWTHEVMHVVHYRATRLVSFTLQIQEIRDVFRCKTNIYIYLPLHSNRHAKR